ncbi:hypothetical protein SAMD00019534_095270 [Acytostelium subglobosum LB1]|uniref:hypothetical protein n=1 Tax=Acytostelium subglobosum LB1 TaxID=1410327 RepID=UPI000644AA14|nr:hypothetical protein SAMD00019534_095270 [Acytostelium subglobosum LB1]GAM26352.1 hypothetical protein SAMD00019534_095270 [Acytostelium subglobosum LB1]|eukprot:XP_012750906.1 hypothetical protein SAMD00019534_095270 [Acytostelium subglobosum LB1]
MSNYQSPTSSSSSSTSTSTSNTTSSSSSLAMANSFLNPNEQMNSMFIVPHQPSPMYLHSSANGSTHSLKRKHPYIEDILSYGHGQHHPPGSYLMNDDNASHFYPPKSYPINMTNQQHHYHHHHHHHGSSYSNAQLPPPSTASSSSSSSSSSSMHSSSPDSPPTFCSPNGSSSSPPLYPITSPRSLEVYSITQSPRTTLGKPQILPALTSSMINSKHTGGGGSYAPHCTDISSSSSPPHLSDMTSHSQDRVSIPLLNLKKCIPIPEPTLVPSVSPHTPSAGNTYFSSPSSLPSTPCTHRDGASSYSLPNSARGADSQRCPSSPTSSSTSTSTTPGSTPRLTHSSSSESIVDEEYLKRAEVQWKKLEYYTNEFNHFIFDTFKSRDFGNGIASLKSKLEDLTNTVKEIEIANNVYKLIPPQTRSRKKRSTKAEKYHKELLGIKRTYVSTPKSKGLYCAFCGTLETPEWRKGPGGHKTLCNACGIHYSKNIKKELKLSNGGASANNPSPANANEPTTQLQGLQSMTVSSLIDDER